MSDSRNVNETFEFQYKLECDRNNESSDNDESTGDEYDLHFEKHYNKRNDRNTYIPKFPIKSRLISDLHRNKKKAGTENVDTRTKSAKFLYSIVAFLLFGVLSVVAAAFFNDTESFNKMKPINSIIVKFPSQNKQFWDTITSGIIETIQFGHPATFIFLHEKNNARTSKELLENLSEYALCHLSKCDNFPVKLDSKLLDSSENFEDYGWLITRFKKKLEQSRVMIIEELDKFPEKYAKVLHFFCDDISPIVTKSIFFFTVEVEKFAENPSYDLRNIEKTLRLRWSNIDEDEFTPLFTRISGMVLRIYSK